jgi:hypothetical protein
MQCMHWYGAPSGQPTTPEHGEGLPGALANAAVIGRPVSLPADRTRAQFAKFVSGEHAFWGRKLKELKIEMD